MAVRMRKVLAIPRRNCVVRPMQFKLHIYVNNSLLGEKGFNIKSVSPKIKHYRTFSSAGFSHLLCAYLVCNFVVNFQLEQNM